MSSVIMRLITSLLCVLVIVNIVSVVVAADPIAPGDARKGRYIFRKCIACHKNNNTPVVCPGDKTKDEWDNYFKKNFKKCRKILTEDNFKKYQFTDTQMSHLLGFLYKYEKDSGEEFTMCR